MSILSQITGIDSIINGILGIINRFVPDKNAQQQIEGQIRLYQVTSDFQNAMAQITVNREEAKSEDTFVSRWRPACAWLCVISFGYHILLLPMIMFIFGWFGFHPDLPVFNADLLSNMLYGMLGLGGFRTVEKIYNSKMANEKRDRISEE